MAITTIMIRTYSHAIPGGFADGGGTVAVTSGASGPAAGTTTPFSPLTAKGENATVFASKYVKSVSFDSTDCSLICIEVAEG
jgi:hypothetical protein